MALFGAVVFHHSKENTDCEIVSNIWRAIIIYILLCKHKKVKVNTKIHCSQILID